MVEYFGYKPEKLLVNSAREYAGEENSYELHGKRFNRKVDGKNRTSSLNGEEKENTAV